MNNLRFGFKRTECKTIDKGVPEKRHNIMTEHFRQLFFIINIPIPFTKHNLMRKRAKTLDVKL